MIGLVPFARQHLGLELWPGQVAVLDAWAASRKRKALLRLGRRSGKGLLAAVAAIHNATVPDYSRFLRPGEMRFVPIVATREAQAREQIRVIRELLSAAPDEDLAALVDEGASTLDEVVFRTGVTVRAMPCSSRSTRGLPSSLVIFDEAAHFNSDTDGHAAFREVWRALTPSTRQFGEMGYVLVTSTPRWAAGWFWDLWRSGLTGTDPGLYVVHRPTWEVNPAITRESLAGEFTADPEGAAVEYGAEFATGGGAFLDPEAVSAAMIAGRRLLPPVPGRTYVAAADPAFAAGGDAFTFAIAHLEGGAAVVDRLEAWQGRTSPLNDDAVLDEIAALARMYGLRSVVSDQYAVVPLTTGLARRGVALKYQPLTANLKADIFATLKRGLNLGLVELPDDPRLRSELVSLESRPLPAGGSRIQAAGGGHDDRAMVVATVVHALVKPGQGSAFIEAWERMAAAPLREHLVVPTTEEDDDHPLPHERSWAELQAIEKRLQSGGRWG